MAFTLEKVLADARKLANRLKDHDGTADSLITQTQTLHKQVDAMKVVSIEIIFLCTEELIESKLSKSKQYCN